MRGPTVEGRPGDATHLRTCVDNCGETAGESDRASFAWSHGSSEVWSVPTTQHGTLAGELMTALRNLHAASVGPLLLLWVCRRGEGGGGRGGQVCPGLRRACRIACPLHAERGKERPGNSAFSREKKVEVKESNGMDASAVGPLKRVN